MAGQDHAACWFQKKNRLRADLKDKPGKEKNMEKIYRRMFRAAKNERDVWKARCKVTTIIAVFFAFCSLWQYCR